MRKHLMLMRESIPYLGLCSCCRRRGVVTACGFRANDEVQHGWSVALCRKCRRAPDQSIASAQRRWHPEAP